MTRKNRITVACSTCGKPITRKPYRIRRSRFYFCNRVCRDSDPAMTLGVRFAAKVDRSGDCWLWTGTFLKATGYGRVYVKGMETAPAHRVAWELVAGTIPEGLDILHTCDNRRCVRNDDVGVYEVDGELYPRRGHLFLGTIAVNSRDMVLKGRSAHGEGQGSAKLTDAKVVEIRALLVLTPKKYTAIARQYGVTPRIIRLIDIGELWKHVA